MKLCWIETCVARYSYSKLQMVFTANNDKNRDEYAKWSVNYEDNVYNCYNWVRPPGTWTYMETFETLEAACMYVLTMENSA